MRQHAYEVLLPTHDQVYLLSRLQRVLGDHIRCPLPDFDSLRQLQSKAAFYSLLEQLGLPVPETAIYRWPERAGDPPTFPCYLKADHGTAGEGVRLVNDREELRDATEELVRIGLIEEGAPYLVQAPCAGTHSVVQCVFRRGELIARHLAETIQRGVGGAQGMRVSVDHPEVVDHMRLLGRHLGWHGPLFIEYFYDPDLRRPAYIEANPRIGETVNATLCGVNLCQLTVEMAVDETVVEPLPRGALGVRSHVDFLLVLAEAMTGAEHTELLKMTAEMVIRSGRYRDTEREMTRFGRDWVSLLPAATAVLQVLLKPSAAPDLVASSTRRYALTDSGARAIDAITADLPLDRMSS